MGIETDPLSYLTRRILILRSAKPVCPNFEAPGHPPPPTCPVAASNLQGSAPERLLHFSLGAAAIARSAKMG